jgi:hypothetical protein
MAGIAVMMAVSAMACQFALFRLALPGGISHWVGLTLPGMIEEPGSFSGISNSANPARGPQDIRRMSLPILIVVHGVVGD